MSAPEQPIAPPVRDLDEPRRLPIGANEPEPCERCKAPIVWAATVAGPNGRGGKAMPLDPIENLAGNVAVLPGHRGQLRARVLSKGEGVDRPIEYAAMPHFATCRGWSTRPEEGAR